MIKLEGKREGNVDKLLRLLLLGIVWLLRSKYLTDSVLSNCGGFLRLADLLFILRCRAYLYFQVPSLNSLFYWCNVHHTFICYTAFIYHRLILLIFVLRYCLQILNKWTWWFSWSWCLLGYRLFELYQLFRRLTDLWWLSMHFIITDAW